jgi:hypothetical protein
MPWDESEKREGADGGADRIVMKITLRVQSSMRA